MTLLLEASYWFLRQFLGFWFVFLRFCPWWVVKFSRWISFSFSRVFFFFFFCFMDLKLTPSSSLYFLFAYRMAIGYEEVSTS